MIFLGRTMDTKVSIEIYIEKPVVLQAFADDLKTTEAESKFVIVPRGDQFNLDLGSIALLVSFFENGGIEFVGFLAYKMFKCFKSEEIKFIEIRTDDQPSMRISSNMTESAIVEALQSILPISHDSSR